MLRNLRDDREFIRPLIVLPNAAETGYDGSAPKMLTSDCDLSGRGKVASRLTAEYSPTESFQRSSTDIRFSVVSLYTLKVCRYKRLADCVKCFRPFALSLGVIMMFVDVRVIERSLRRRHNQWVGVLAEQ